MPRWSLSYAILKTLATSKFHIDKRILEPRYKGMTGVLGKGLKQVTSTPNFKGCTCRGSAGESIMAPEGSFNNI
jgi:hypothetical protein